jgi:hypothetical protein
LTGVDAFEGPAGQAGELPLFGLPEDWTGDRWLMPVATEGDQAIAQAILHGPLVEGRGPQIVVETSRRVTAYWGNPLCIAAEYLWRRADGWSWLPRLDEEARELLARVRSEEISITIDDEPVLFRALTEGTDWVARSEYRGFSVRIVSRNFPKEGLRLVSVIDRTSLARFPPDSPEHDSGNTNWVTPWAVEEPGAG